MEMAFNTFLEVVGDTAKITVSGELDASAVSAFRAQIEAGAAQHPKRLVLYMHELEYIASAGLRALIFAKQKMGTHVEMYAIAPQEQVLETFQMTGFHYSIHILAASDTDNLEHV
jgi:anti-anti-sigma factor